MHRLTLQEAEKITLPGWHMLLRSIYLILEEYNRENAPITAGVVYAGERYGGLCVQVDWYDSKLDTRINRMMADSFRYCGVCGDVGTPRKGKTVKTLCDRHASGRAPDRDWI